MIVAYKEVTEQSMIRYYQSLGERQRRQYAAVESQKLGFGGQTYISNLLGISPKTLRRGEKELANSLVLPALSPYQQRISGGGRKKICEVRRTTD
jgi:hypothetical protein